MMFFVAVACPWWFVSRISYICQTNINLFITKKIMSLKWRNPHLWCGLCKGNPTLKTAENKVQSPHFWYLKWLEVGRKISHDGHGEGLYLKHHPTDGENPYHYVIMHHYVKFDGTVYRPINTHCIRWIWGWSLRVPSQQYHHVPYESIKRDGLLHLMFFQEVITQEFVMPKERNKLMGGLIFNLII